MDNTPPLTPEILVPRLGDYLIERGLITTEQLTFALQEQAAIRKQQQTAPLIGQLLVELGILDRNALDQAITEQVLQLRHALNENNRQLERRVQERTGELERALMRLAELNQLKSNFVANISHELRTPLTHLKGYLDLIRSGDLGSLSDDQINALNTIAKAGDRLGRLIEDLILFAAAEKTEMPLLLESVNLNTICSEITNQMQPKAHEQKISILFNPLPEEPLVYADRQKIGWVIHQFIDNAVKFTSAGGVVTVDLIPDELYIRVKVSDSGIGIAPTRLREVFEPFHQLDGSSTRKYGGTGLGLSLALKIVNAHDTDIQVVSELGKGSQFSFTLRRVTPGS